MDSTKWKWFLAANAQGRWLITEGFAIARIGSGTFEATLVFSADTEPYMTLNGTVDSDGFVEAEGVSSNTAVPDIHLRGAYSIEKDPSGKVTHSIVLSDGWTVVGIAASV